ncbi:hypothetical protein MTO96_009723 [Rhipicephalus appendiculatus]
MLGWPCSFDEQCLPRGAYCGSQGTCICRAPLQAVALSCVAPQCQPVPALCPLHTSHRQDCSAEATHNAAAGGGRQLPCSRLDHIAATPAATAAAAQLGQRHAHRCGPRSGAFIT